MKGAIATIIIAPVTFTGIGVGGKGEVLFLTVQQTIKTQTECFKKLSVETFIIKETAFPGLLTITGFKKIFSIIRGNNHTTNSSFCCDFSAASALNSYRRLIFQRSLGRGT